MQVNDAEEERLASELEHEAATLAFNDAQAEAKKRYKDLKKHITKSKLVMCFSL